ESWIKAVCRDFIARERRPRNRRRRGACGREGIVDGALDEINRISVRILATGRGTEDAGKISGLHGRGGNRGIAVGEAEALDTAGRRNAGSLVVAEDEKFVLDDGTARS